MSNNPKHKIVIGNFNENVICEVLRLQSLCNLSPWSKTDYKNEIYRDNSCSLVALYENKVAGFIVLRITSDEAEIYNIAVSPYFRNRGIGAMLLSESIERATQNKKINRVWLEVRESNKSAFRFYRKNGFQLMGKRKNFYSYPIEDALIMLLELN